MYCLITQLRCSAEMSLYWNHHARQLLSPAVPVVGMPTTSSTAHAHRQATRCKQTHSSTIVFCLCTNVTLWCLSDIYAYGTSYSDTYINCKRQLNRKNYFNYNIIIFLRKITMDKAYYRCRIK